MSEDSGFIGDKPQKKEKREYAPDFFGYLGKGMLANEALINAPGLTPLSHLDEPQMNADKSRCELNILFSSDETKLATEGTENTETIRNSSGLTPLSHHQKNLSGLSVPLSLRGEFHKRGVI